MADFWEALKYVRSKEGTLQEPYDNDPRDSGNWIGQKVVKGVLTWVAEIGVGIVAGTIWGITALEVREYYGRPITADDVKNFPMSAIEEVYRKKYWNVMKGDQINDAFTAGDIMQFGVNVGIITGIKQWQRSQNLPETGIMDERTLNEANT